MSQLVRATNRLHFTRINGNPSFIQPNYSSLMFRRDPVVSSIGYWDEVNRAGDAEFRNRLTAWHGSPPVIVGDTPMSFLRVRHGSLTSGEIHRGYFDVRRRWYESSSNRWHRSAIESGSKLYLAPRGTTRKFSAPAAMTGTPAREYDVLYATDFRFAGGNTTVSVNEIGTLLANGYRVGLIQLDSPVLGVTNDLTERILTLSREPNCSVLSLNDDVSAPLLIVRHPTVMQYAQPARSRIEAAQAVLIVNHAPAMRDGTGRHYDILTCAENFEVIFGRAPVIAPESGAIRASLSGLGVDSLLGDDDWNGMLPTTPLQPRVAEPQRRPVIGRHSRDNPEKWPSSIDDLTALYPVDGSRDVRFLGGADVALARLAPREITGWTVYPFGSLPPGEFLAQVDFWVYFHAEHLIESFGMATAEAMASGAVVILPHYMEPTFGEGAVYCKPDEVQDVVDEFWSDPAKYAEQSRLAVEVAAERFTAESFLRRVRALIAAQD
jgi:glycosyltransferase involved in cell wall biosynthesis